jgi:hypothetical protein
LPERTSIPIDAPIGIIPIHFDVPKHYIPFDTFVETARQTRNIIDSLNEQIFGGELQYEFVVFPPEEGTFLQKLGVIIVSAGCISWAFIESDVGRAFIRGLTEHEPAYYAEQIGIQLKELNAESTTPVETGSPENDTARSELLNRIMVDSTKSFLTTDKHTLQRVGVTPEKFYEAYLARNEFYQALARDTEVQGIGFDETPSFPIRRKDFALMQVTVVPREDAPPDIEWEVEKVLLKVTSPNWDMNDSKRPWKGKDDLNHDRFFWIDDAQFWRRVHSKQLNPEIVDTMLVQLAYQKRRRRTGRVLRVLEFNDVLLAPPLDDNALSALLGSYHKPHNEDLFSFGIDPPCRPQKSVEQFVRRTVQVIGSTSHNRTMPHIAGNHWITYYLFSVPEAAVSTSNLHTSSSNRAAAHALQPLHGCVSLLAAHARRAGCLSASRPL